MENKEMDTQYTEDQQINNSEVSNGEEGQESQNEEPTDNLTDNCAKMAEQPAISAEEEAAIWKDKFVRLSAEYDNFRKRTVKEKLDIIAAGGEDVVRSMLDVLDDMDRALAAMAASGDLEAIKQGIILIDSKLRSTLQSRGLTEIEAVGNELDTDLHEAVARIEAREEAMKGRIIDVVQKGYKLKDKIIRYAKVVVGQ